MFLGLCALALLVVVPLTGGSLSKVAALPFRGVRWLLGALVLQVLVTTVRRERVWPALLPHAWNGQDVLLVTIAGRRVR